MKKRNIKIRLINRLVCIENFKYPCNKLKVVGMNYAEKIDELNKVLHEPNRLFIMKFIAEMGGHTDFNTLIKATGLSKGNLWSHLQVLEEAGYLEVKKGFLRRKPHTDYYLTEKGREALAMYVSNMIKELREIAQTLKDATIELK
jgi:DNA-binding MarR family transcriptional regulator